MPTGPEPGPPPERGGAAKPGAAPAADGTPKPEPEAAAAPAASSRPEPGKASAPQPSATQPGDAAEPTTPEPTTPEPAGATRESTTPEPATATLEPAAPAGERSARFWVIGGVVAVLCLAIVVVGVVLAVNDGGGPGDSGLRDPDPVGEAPPGDGPDSDPEPERLVTGAVDGRESAELHLVSGTTVATVRMAAMGDTLYEVSTPPEGDSVPRVVDADERIEVHLDPVGDTGPSSLEIVLNDQVRWSAVRLSAGAEEKLVDLTGAVVDEIEFGTGSSRIELTLPEPEGTVPIRINDGAGTVEVTAPAGVPVRAIVDNGAGRVVIDGETHTGIGPGTEFTAGDWDAAEDRYDLSTDGIGELVVTSGTASDESTEDD